MRGRYEQAASQFKAGDGIGAIISIDRSEVIETFFLDWPLSFGVGLLFGLASRRQMGAPWFSTRALRLGLAYQHLGLIAVSIGLYVARPDWMWMYWIDASVLPLASIVLAFALYEVCFVAGFVLGNASARLGVGLAVITAVSLTVAQVATWERLSTFATGEEFGAGTAASGMPLGVVLALAGSVGALIVTLRLATAGATAVPRAPDPT